MKFLLFALLLFPGFLSANESGAWDDIKSGTMKVLRGGSKAVKKAANKVDEKIEENQKEDEAEARAEKKPAAKKEKKEQKK